MGKTRSFSHFLFRHEKIKGDFGRLIKREQGVKSKDFLEKIEHRA